MLQRHPAWPHCRKRRLQDPVHHPTSRPECRVTDRKAVARGDFINKDAGYERSAAAATITTKPPPIVTIDSSKATYVATTNAFVIVVAHIPHRAPQQWTEQRNRVRERNEIERMHGIHARTQEDRHAPTRPLWRASSDAQTPYRPKQNKGKIINDALFTVNSNNNGDNDGVDERRTTNDEQQSTTNTTENRQRTSNRSLANRFEVRWRPPFLPSQSDSLTHSLPLTHSHSLSRTHNHSHSLTHSLTHTHTHSKDTMVMTTLSHL